MPESTTLGGLLTLAWEQGLVEEYINTLATQAATADDMELVSVSPACNTPDAQAIALGARLRVVLESPTTAPEALTVPLMAVHRAITARLLREGIEDESNALLAALDLQLQGLIGHLAGMTNAENIRAMAGQPSIWD